MFNEIDSRSLKLIESNQYMVSYCDEDAEILEAISENFQILLHNQFLLERIFERLGEKITCKHLKDYEDRLQGFRQKLAAAQRDVPWQSRV
jgi:hypothetical protein